MALNDTVHHLSLVPFFQGFDRDTLRLVAFSARQKTLREGDVLFRKGDTSSCAYFLESGALGLWLTSSAEPSETCHAGTLLGELALLIETSRPCSAVALDPCSVLLLDRLHFRRVLQEAPHLVPLLEGRVAHQLGDFMQGLDAWRLQFGSAKTL